MAIKPELNIAVAGEDIVSNKYNENFNKLLEYIEDVSDELILKVNTINSQISTSVINNLQQAYPIGSIYIGVTDDCPMASLFGTWEKVSEGRVLQGASGSNYPGDTIEAGLPNINATFGALSAPQSSPSYSGAVNIKEYYGLGVTHNNAAHHRSVLYDFKASRSSSIYSDDIETVQPPAYVVNIWKRTA